MEERRLLYFNNIFKVSLTSGVKLLIHLGNVVVWFIFAAVLLIWYVEVRVSRSISENPLGFEITRVDCTPTKSNFMWNSSILKCIYRIYAKYSNRSMDQRKQCRPRLGIAYYQTPQNASDKGLFVTLFSSFRDVHILDTPASPSSYM